MKQLKQHCTPLKPFGALTCRRAWEALGQKDGGRLRAGLDLAKKLQRAIVQCVFHLPPCSPCSTMQEACECVALMQHLCGSVGARSSLQEQLCMWPN